MSESEQSGAGRREVAYRLFAAEYDDADFSYSESDEERAPNYVVTPTGARINRLFVVGVLTEVEQVNDDVLRARVVDPTGAFVVYAGQYQPDEMAFLERADPPTFVSVTGKARTFQPDDSDTVYTSVRPESINAVDAETRDRWTVGTAERTLDRVGTMATALAREERGDELRSALEAGGVDEGLAAGTAMALEHYGTTPTYLQALRETALDAARVVAGERDEVRSLTQAPDAAGSATVADLPTRDDVSMPASAHSTADVSETTADTAETSADAAESTAETTSAGDQSTASDTSTPTASTSTTESSTESATTESPTPEPESTESSGTASADAESTPTDAATATDTETSEATSTASAETDSIDETSESAAAETDPEPEPVETTATTESGGQTEREPVGGANPQQVDTPAQSADDDDDIGDFEPGEFELEDDERERIEEEYGTDFSTGTEVDDPGEADIETPDPDELADQEAETAEPATESTPEPEPASGSETEPETEPDAEPGPESEPEPAVETSPEDESPSADEPAEDVDLSEAVMDVMRDLNGDDGADREAVIESVVDTYGADPDAVEDAIQDALMDGLCYEPNDATLKPI